MTWIVDTLRRLATWLESRRNSVAYVEMHQYYELTARMARVEGDVAKILARQEEEIQKLKGEIQKLSLHAGFTRPTQAGPRR